MSWRRVPSDDAVSSSEGNVEMELLLEPEKADHSPRDHPFLNVDVLYMFKPKPGFRNIKCHSHKKLSSPVQCSLVDQGLVLLNAKKDQWSYMICGRVEGWVHLDESYFGPRGPLTRVERFRRYEAWPGRALFLLGGRLMLGADARMFLATNVLMIGTMVLVSIGVLPQLDHSAVYTVVSAALFLFSFSNFWLTAVVEPGIIPRHSVYKSPEEPADMAAARAAKPDSLSINSPVHGSPVSGNGSAEAVPVALRWKMCETCNLFRPPRSKHCATCDNCVEVFDHHCPWVGQCVGKRNYKYFMFFLISSTVLIIFFIGLCGLACYDKLLRSGMVVTFPNFIETLFAMPVAIIALVSLTFGFWSITPLLSYHLYLISVGETTNENVRDIYLKEENVFNRGCYKNFMDALFSKTAPSALPDMREVINASDYMNSIRREREEAEL